jgi:predicted chitinase
MPRKTNNQKVASSVRGSVEKFSGDIESLSSQIANLTDAIISEKNLTASKIKSERELLAKKTALRNLKEDIDDLRSERKKNQDKLDKLLADAESEAQKEKEELRKKETQYSDSAKKSFEGGQFISGMIFKFLGRNEKDKKQIEVERKADKQAQIEELQNRSKALKEQTSTLKGLRTNIIGLNTNIIESEEERKYEQRDAEKVASEVSKFASVKLLDIEPEALSKLEKIFKSSVSEKENSNTLSDILSSSRGLLTFLSSTAGIAGIATTLTAIAALVSTKFKTDEYVAEENKKAIKDQETSTKLIEGRITESKALEQLKTNAEGSNLALQRLNAAAGDLTLQVQDEYAAKIKLMKIYDEEAKKKFGTTLQTPTETLKQWLESDKQKLSIETDYDIRKKLEERIKYNESVLSGRNTTPIPSGPSVQKVETPKPVPTQAAPQKVETPKPVPSIGIPKAGAKPTAQVESSIIDRVLGEIGSFLPTGVGSLTPTAMAATTPYYSPITLPRNAAPILSPNKISPTQALEQALRERGLSKQFIAAAIANVFKESAGGMVPENLDYSKDQAERVLTIFGESRILGKNSLTKEQQEKFKEYKQLKPEQQKQFSFLTDEQRAKIKSMTSDINAFTEQVYGGEFGRKQLGNKERGDAVKFKGRGLVQLTGRGNYEAASKALGVDLVSNPELVNDPIIGPKVAAWYLENSSRNRAKKMGLDLNTVSDQSKVNEIVTSAVAGSTIKRGEKTYLGGLLSKVDTLSNEYNTGGLQMLERATTNKALKEPPQGNNVFAVNNTNVVNQQKSGGKIRETPPPTYNPQDRTLHSNTRTGA